METTLCEKHELIVRDRDGRCYTLVGKPGKDGKDGRDGIDGITPLLRIENNIWQVSYDNGETWENKGSAIGTNGTNGEDGIDGVSSFVSIVFKRSASSVTYMPAPSKAEGSFDSPVPSGWSNSIPTLPEDGEYNKIWSSRRIFTKPYNEKLDTGWSLPAVVEDAADIDVYYSSSEKLTDEVKGQLPLQGSNEENSFWHNIGDTSDKWMATAYKRANGIWSKWAITQIKGESGSIIREANIFIRSDIQPSTPYNTECSYSNILPNGLYNSGWRTSIPEFVLGASSKIWMSKRIFTSDGESPQEALWSIPILIQDSSNFDICYSYSEEEPDINSLPLQGSGENNDLWHYTFSENDKWLALATKKSGDQWSNWNIIKIKYKDGVNATNVKLRYTTSVNEFSKDSKTPPDDVWEDSWTDSIPTLSEEGWYIWVKQTQQEWNSEQKQFVDIENSEEYYRLTGSPGASATSYIADLSNEMSGIPCKNNRPVKDDIILETDVILLYGLETVASRIEIPNLYTLVEYYGAEIVEVDANQREVELGTLENKEHTIRIKFANKLEKNEFPEVLPITIKVYGVGDHYLGSSTCTFTVLPIEEGADATFVEIFPNKDSIIFDTEATDTTIQTLLVDLKYISGSTQRIDRIKSPYSVKYSLQYPIDNIEAGDVKDYTSTGIAVQKDNKCVYLALILNGQIIDSKTVPVLRDGKQGESGDIVTYRYAYSSFKTSYSSNRPPEDCIDASGSGENLSYWQPLSALIYSPSRPYLWIKQTLKKWNKESKTYDPEEINYYRVTGEEGPSSPAYIADLTNRMVPIPCDSNNKLVKDNYIFETTTSLYYNAQAIESKFIILPNEKQLLDNYGITVIELDDDNIPYDKLGDTIRQSHKVRFTINKGNYIFPEVLNINFQLIGQIGEHINKYNTCTLNILPLYVQEMYELSPSLNEVKFDLDEYNNCTPTSKNLKVKIKDVKGNVQDIRDLSDSDSGKLSIKYSKTNEILNYSDSSNTYNSSGITVNSTDTNIFISLFLYRDGGWILIDRVNVPIVKNGLSSVTYTLNTSASKIRYKENTFTPEYVTCTVTKSIGNTVIPEYNWNNDGLKLYYGYDNSSIQEYNGNNVYIVQGNTKYNSINFYLKKDSQIIDTADVIVIKDGNSVVTSYMFKRSATAPTNILTTEGSFYNLTPSNSYGWTSTIPSNSSDPVYMQSRVFAEDGGLPQQDSWQSPVLLLDANDIDIAYSGRAEDPGAPTRHGSDPIPSGGTKNDYGNGWNATPINDIIWMAVDIKIAGSWRGWKVFKTKGEQGIAAGFGTPTASVDYNVGTPSVTVTESGPDTEKVFNFDFKNLKGEKGNPGTAAGFGTPTATIDDTYGTPSVTVTADGPDTAKIFKFDFQHLKGEPGVDGTDGQSAYIDITFSSNSNPDLPINHYSDYGNSWDSTPTDTTLWMAIDTNVDGVWQGWKKVKIKGNTGDAGQDGTDGYDGVDGKDAGFGIIDATVDSNVGIPSVSVSYDGENTAKNLHFAFKNLKGEKGDPGKSPRPMGNWTSGITYQYLDLVRSGKSTLICKNVNGTTQSPESIFLDIYGNKMKYQNGEYVLADDQTIDPDWQELVRDGEGATNILASSSNDGLMSSDDYNNIRILLDAKDELYTKINAIPTVYNGQMSLYLGGSSLGTFTANQSTNNTITIPVASDTAEGVVMKDYMQYYVGNAPLEIYVNNTKIEPVNGDFTANKKGDASKYYLTIPKESDIKTSLTDSIKNDLKTEFILKTELTDAIALELNGTASSGKTLKEVLNQKFVLNTEFAKLEAKEGYLYKVMDSSNNPLKFYFKDGATSLGAMSGDAIIQDSFYCTSGKKVKLNIKGSFKAATYEPGTGTAFSGSKDTCVYYIIPNYITNNETKSYTFLGANIQTGNFAKGAYGGVVYFYNVKNYDYTKLSDVLFEIIIYLDKAPSTIDYVSGDLYLTPYSK